ncbi:exocyst complex component EXO70 [Chitinophagaceae bacterium LB-8]|uniref:Exocyst complex component EXO70 n=1 Tax=Paraflavisolibacter caeni TaxID=2982496 RepID=A0A9X2XVJ1_9BACT|nr:hypothetical protein [Paraflavisolibacter caeni]MCU7549197.1 exocyst complex component EXO70 [Paraflavisolibacter caeni]
MIPQFENLSDEERKLLYKTPVLISVLASCSYGQVNSTQKKDAMKLAHLRKFTAAPLLQPYYRELEKSFKEQFEEAEKMYFPFDDEKRNELKKEIARVNGIISKLETFYGEALLKSLERYAKHVKHSVHTVFQDIIFPIAYSKMNN